MKILFFNSRYVILLFACLAHLPGCTRNNMELTMLSIISFSPGIGMPGDEVVITATGLADNSTMPEVDFNGVAATIDTITESTLTVTVPQNATTGKITIRFNGQTAVSTQIFTVSTPVIPLSILRFTPQSGRKGDQIVITGAGFDSIAANNTVRFGAAIASIIQSSDTQLVVRVPNEAITAKISIAVGGDTAFSETDFEVTWLVSTIAGDGQMAFIDGPGMSASFNTPRGIAFDPDGNLLVADRENHSIRKISTSGVVSTVATFSGRPEDLAIDPSGNIYVVDILVNIVRKITPDGTVSRFAGSGLSGYADGPFNVARFDDPSGIVLDADGNMFIGDLNNNRIRKITPDGTVSTFAGSGDYGMADGTGSAAQFLSPRELTIDKNGNLFVLDENRIRKITPDAKVTTVAGSGHGGYMDGPVMEAKFADPSGIEVDAEGNLYVGDNLNNRIRKITTTGKVVPFAGDGGNADGHIFRDGPSNIARFDIPSGIAINASGEIFVSDTGNNRIRKIEP